MKNTNNEIKDIYSSKINQDGLIKFLSSKFIPGIGKVYATKIADKFGVEILKEDKISLDDLSSISGLNENKAEGILSNIKKLNFSSSFMAFLYSSGLSDTDVNKIYSHYKKFNPSVIIEDPYDMVENVWKLSFFTADKIGQNLGIEEDDLRRLRGAILTAVKIYAEDGHMFATEKDAVKTASRITGVMEEKFSEAIESLIKNERLIRIHQGLYLPPYYIAEKDGAEKIALLAKSNSSGKTETLLPITDRMGHPLSDDQLEAIKTVMTNPITIITGGPGTGKTTSLRGIIKILEAQGKKIVLVAPTGRAAKRMSDLTGLEAKTIHRLLGYRQGEGYRKKKFEADILIIDEASMLEQVLFNHLLQSLNPGTKIVLVGDTDQLPSIGAGDVLREMIDSKTIPVISLKENFRQKDGSMIAANAAAIKEGKMPVEKNGSDFTLIREETTRKIRDRILSLISEELPEKYHIDSKYIQVVSPQQEGPLGAKQLNLDIQQRVNPNSPGLKHGLKTFRLGDRVMQTSNSSERKVYNGETGWISEVNQGTETLEVTFQDGKKLIYQRKELKELSLAYATTVHKLQGSETEYLVMPMTMSHRPMLYRNLLYTGVSRASRKCILVGEEKALRLAVSNNNSNRRNSNFKKLLRENLPCIRQ